MTDTDLMFAVAGGDEAAKAAIIELHRPRIVRAAADTPSNYPDVTPSK